LRPGRPGLPGGRGPGGLLSGRLLEGLLLAGLVAATSFLAGCAEAPAAAHCAALPGEVPVRGGEEVGAWGEEVRDGLRELWRAGGLRDDEHLAMPVSATLSRSGILAVPDFQLSEVVGVDPDGSWLGALLPPGQGPGELVRPVVAAWDTVPVLHVVDVSGGKVERWDPAGEGSGTGRVAVELLHRVLSSGEVAWMGMQPGHAILVREDGPEIDGTVRRRILRQAFDGGAIDTVLAFDVQGSGYAGIHAPGWPIAAAAADADGRLALADPGGAFLVEVLWPELEPLFRVCRDEPPTPPGPESAILDSDPEVPDAMRHALRELPTPDRPAAIGRLLFDADGRLWVQRERPRLLTLDGFHGVPGAEHLVFDREGRWLGRVRLPPRAGLQSARGDTVIVFETGELDETWVVAYEM
jgi:hypothetical protein